MRRDGSEDDAACADFRALADLDVAEDFCPGSDEHAAPDFGVTVALVLAGASECDRMEDGDVVLDYGGFSCDEAGGVVEEDAAAELRGWMDVDREDLGDEALQVAGELLAVVIPEPVGDTMAGDGLKALEPEKGGENGVARRVAFGDGDEVAPNLFGNS